MSDQLERLSYTVAQARAVTGLGETVIAKAIARGDLQTIRVGPRGRGQGRRILISAASLERFVRPDDPADADPPAEQ